MNQFYNRTGLLAIAGFILLAIPQPFPVFAVMGFVLFFTCFDIVGYIPDHYDNITSYRFLQASIEAILLLYLLRVFDWHAALAAAILHYTLVCDVLFYFIKNIPLQPFTWFTVSPIIFLFNKILHRPAPVWSILLSTGVGILLAFWLLF